MIGIYLFTNKINGKRYIGQSIDIGRRYYQHSVNSYNANCLEYNSYFYKAIRKYGFNNFSFEILEECQKEELDEKEKYWIQYYNSNDMEKGYNLTIGGSAGPDKSKTIYQYDLNKNFIRTFKNAYEAAEILKLHQSAIQRCAAHGPYVKSVGGYIFTYEGDDLTWYKNNQKKGVVRISKNGEEIEFETLKEAAENSNTCGANISKVLKGQRKTAGGYRWKEI